MNGCMTNEDYIRNMNNEDLAEFLKECMWNDIKPACRCSVNECEEECNESCFYCILEWLKQPYNKI